MLDIAESAFKDSVVASRIKSCMFVDLKILILKGNLRLIPFVVSCVSISREPKVNNVLSSKIPH